eukprot:TRINITY_DN11292_c0_g1_i1.p1 TRINITY_DN11292_c0_g1~~TRINITY_DN11292_c0_g1_i1.p1  ORF type:complete len:197 (+),score=27.85 TRINITY_DN11292_c0_g1_i1:78-668(+)
MLNEHTVDTLAEKIQGFEHVPQLFVFDLDLTLWTCEGSWIDTCSGPPFTLDKNSTKLKPFARSGANGECKLYDECWTVLHALMKLKRDGLGVKLACASRTQEPKWARELLRVLNIYDWFDYEEIYPTTKTKHFASLKKRSGLEYVDMMFFDDEDRNIIEVGNLGVTSIYVRRGLTVKNVLQGLDEYNNSKALRTKK